MALCTFEDIQARLPDMATIPPAQVGSFAEFIEEASAAAETYCGRTFLSGSVAVSVFKGLGYNGPYDYCHDSYTTPEGPICRTPAIQYMTSDVWTTLDATWEVDEDGKGVYFTDGNYFVLDILYRVRYEYGYDGIAGLPKDLRGAVARHTIWLYNTTTQLGTMSNSSADGRNYTYSPNLPASITAVYDQYIL